MSFPLLLADALILIGMSRLLLFSPCSPAKNLLLVFMALTILDLTILAAIFMQALGLKQGHSRLALFVIVILASSVVLKLPTLVALFYPTVLTLRTSNLIPHIANNKQYPGIQQEVSS